MPVDTYTNEVMKHLPAGLRPNPYNIDEDVMGLVSKGWKPVEIATHVVKDGATNPALAVSSIRRAKDYPAPSVRAEIKKTPIGHLTCTEHEGCELCACDPARGVIHHVPVPMPDWFREKFAPLLKGLPLSKGIPND